VGGVRHGRLVECDRARLPLFLQRTGDVEAWLRGRAIDAHRSNSRLLKRALRIAQGDDLDAVLRVHAATITDAYWFCAEGEALTYDDVRFKENPFAALALRGDPDSFNKNYAPTPELTNIGSYEKCWLLRDNAWWMVKQGSDLERFSELFICRLGQALGFPMAEYFAEDDTVISPDFTQHATMNFESADGIMGDDEDYLRNFDVFYGISPQLAREYLQIIYMDALCFNMDRHTKNYGVLRDVDSGEILSMAPNFDNNIALFARGLPKLERAHDKLIALFCELLAEDERALAFAKEFPTPTPQMIAACAQATDIAVDLDALHTFVMNGSAQLQTHMQALTMDVPAQAARLVFDQTMSM